MAITIYHDFQIFCNTTGQLNKIDFENFSLMEEDVHAHYIKPYLIPNPFILDGVKFSSPICLFTTYDLYKNDSLLFLEPNAIIYFPSTTNGVLLKLENIPNSSVKVTTLNSETLTTPLLGSNDHVFLGFSSPKGIHRIEFIESPAFISSMFFTSSVF